MNDTSHTIPAAVYDPDSRTLVINELVVTDPAVIDELPHWSTGHRGSTIDPAGLVGVDLGPFCREALAVGATAIRGAGQSQAAHHLDHLFVQVGERVGHASAEAARETSTAADQAAKAMSRAAAEVQRALVKDGQTARQALTEHVDRSRRALTSDIERLVGGDNPELAAQLKVLLAKFGVDLDDRVGRRTDELFSKAARQLDPRDPTSPLAEFMTRSREMQAGLLDRVDAGHKEIQSQLEKLALQVSAATAATTATRTAASVTPIKGGEYADNVHDQLRVLAAQHGDDYADTSSEPGRISRCRKGDGVLRVPTGAGTDTVRIVVEMSDSDTARRGWTDYLDEAERNRDAVASLGLVRTVEQMNGERLRYFGPRRLVLAFDPLADDSALLKVVVQLLRTQAALAVSRSGGDQVRTAEEKVAEATQCLQKLADVQKTAGNIRQGAEKIDLACAGIQSTVQRLLAEAMTALGGNGTGTLAA